MKRVIINKLGGEIMSTPQTLELALRHMRKQQSEREQPVFVVSALAGITDRLIGMVRQLEQGTMKKGAVLGFCRRLARDHEAFARSVLRHADGAVGAIQSIIQVLEDDLSVIKRYGGINIVHDQIVSYGESLSSEILVALLHERGIESTKILGARSGIRTDDHFGDANIHYGMSKPRIQKTFELLWKKYPEDVPVVTGYAGANNRGLTTLLGRGGTDTTACVIGAALGAKRVMLWKSVPGVLSTDPRIVPASKTVPCLTYSEAEESGKVVCNKAVWYLAEENIEARVGFIKDPSRYTRVTNRCPTNGKVKIISSKSDLTFIAVSSPEVKQYGFLHRVSGVLTDEEINMVLIRNTRDTLYIVMERVEQAEKRALKRLRSMSYRITTFPCAMVTIVGELDWKVAESANTVLQRVSPDAVMGVFPYEHSTRFEAIVRPHELTHALQEFHKVFISHT